MTRYRRMNRLNNPMLAHVLPRRSWRVSSRQLVWIGLSRSQDSSLRHRGGQATQEHSTYYDSMASDSEDEGGFLDRDLADNSKNSSTSYPVASASRCQVSKSLSSLASQHLNDMRIAIRHSDEDECCADSGVTNHMFKDYSTFVSYHKCHNKTAKLGNSTELPILGYGTAKFSLTGKIIVVCSPTCCTLFVNIGIWRDVVSLVIMTVTHSCSFQILQLKWMILLTVS